MAKILIVDDSYFIRTVLKKYLTKLKHEIIGEATNGLTAIQMYKDLSPDLVTLDIVMDDDGMTAMEEIMKIDPKAKILLYASQATPVNIIRAIKTGVKSYLMKPILGEAFKKAIDNNLNCNNNKNCGCFGFEKGSTFMMSMFNNSMEQHGIFMNDLLIIDKTTKPQNQDLVLIAYGSYLGFGRYIKEKNGNIKINMENECAVQIDENKAEMLGSVKGLVRLFNPQICIPLN